MPFGYLVFVSLPSFHQTEIFLISWTQSHLSLSYLISAVGLVPLPLRCAIIASGSEGELPGTGVVVVLWLSDDVWVRVHGEVDFLQVWGGLKVILGVSGTLLLPGHFLIDRSRRLWSVLMPRLHLQHNQFMFGMEYEQAYALTLCMFLLKASVFISSSADCCLH